jgi:hypothetical protein
MIFSTGFDLRDILVATAAEADDDALIFAVAFRQAWQLGNGV